LCELARNPAADEGLLACDKTESTISANIVFLATKKTVKKLSLYIQFALKKHINSY